MAKTSASSKTTKKKKTKRLLSGPAVAAMKASKPTPKPNPFETIWSRPKFDILGKRRKGEERRVGLARSLGIEKRKKTLLKEYEQSMKSSVFIDNRIGEKNGSLPEFEKAVMRMQRERQSKLKRASKYNLSDGEDEEELYESKSLERDDFEDEVPPDDGDEGEDFGTKNSGEPSTHWSLHSLRDPANTSLLDGGGDTNKSKSQVMKEIISKSKFYKAEKAKAKEEDDHLMEKLDEDFASLAQTETLRSLTNPNKINALKALLNKHSTKQPIPEGSSGPAAKDYPIKEQPDAYDKLVKELVLDRRAHATDRTKTPEEIALEEKERLEELEKQRQERMHATGYSSDEASEDGTEIDNPLSKKVRFISGDDLGDSFANDGDTSEKKGWVDQIYENDKNSSGSEGDKENTESEGDEDDEDSDESNDDVEGDDNDEHNDREYSSKNEFTSVKNWEQSDDDLYISDEEAENQDNKEIDGSNAKIDFKETDSAGPLKVRTAESIALVKHEKLPYVIEAPKTLTELCNLVDKCSPSEVVEAIQRIRACNSIRLSAENRKKMQVFYGVLLQYFAVLANERPLKVNIVNSLVKPLIEMSAETPYFAAICARQRLLHIRTRFVEDMKTSGKNCWPSLKTLLLLRLWSLIFPCSDFRHVVITPVFLLMSEYLMRCPLTCGRDLAAGSFLCSLVLTVIKQSKKFCPEAIVFLQTLLLSSLEAIPENQHFKFYYLMEIQTLKPWLHISDHVDDLKPVDFLKVMDMEDNCPFFTSSDFKASILASVAETLKEFIFLYEGLSSFAEIFSPISLLLREVLDNPNLPSLLKNKMLDVSDLIEKKTRELNILRKPLRMRKQKPVPIKLLNPKFEENFVKGREYDPDREKAERRKMKKRLKSEMKGAIRELRKDGQFIYGLKEKNRLMEEVERDEKYGKALSFLQQQEHLFKSGQLGKGRKRRR